MPRTLSGLLKDKVVLYIVLLFSVTNVIGYLMLHNLEAVLIFVMIGLLTTYFTKNMIVVMLTSLIATNAIVGAQRGGGVRRGRGGEGREVGQVLGQPLRDLLADRGLF